MDITTASLVVVGVGWILFRRVVGDVVEIRSLVVLPVVLVGIGLFQLPDHLGGTAVASLLLGAVVAAGFGVVRGATVHLGRRDGELWMRYRAVTAVLWVLSFVAQAVLLGAEHLVAGGAADDAILLSAGIGVLAESVVVLLRALHRDGDVVWRKGDATRPHQPSPAFDRMREHVRSGGPVLLRRDW